MKNLTYSQKRTRAITANVVFLGTLTPFMFSVINDKRRGRTFFIINWFVIGLFGSGLPSAATPNQPARPAQPIILIIGAALWLFLLVAAWKVAPKDEIQTETNEVSKESTEIPKAPKIKTKTLDVPEVIKPADKIETESIISKVFKKLDYFLSGYWKVRKLRKSIAATQTFISQATQVRDSFQNLIDNLIITPSSGKEEHEILNMDGAVLVEPRKGARVSERTSTSSGRAYGGVRVGRVYLGQSGRSTSSSRSVSYPAPDILADIDNGRFLLTTHRVSFAGSMFTRSTDYKKMLDFNSDANSLLIAPRTGTKVWITKFPLVSYAWAAHAILEVVVESESQILDKTPLESGISKLEMIQSNLRSKLFEINQVIESNQATVSDLGHQIENLME